MLRPATEINKPYERNPLTGILTPQLQPCLDKRIDQAAGHNSENQIEEPHKHKAVETPRPFESKG